MPYPARVQIRVLRAVALSLIGTGPSYDGAVPMLLALTLAGHFFAAHS